MKKTTIKLTLSVQMKQDLKNVAALSGGSVPEVIRGYLRDALYSPPRPTEVYPPRAPRVVEKKNKKKKKNNNPSTANETTLPPDFDPPERITEQAQLNRSEALRIFRDWATAKEKKFANWEDAFAIACNGWIPDARPDVREQPRQPSTKRFDQPTRD